jgi:hypothetical protein
MSMSSQQPDSRDHGAAPDETLQAVVDAAGGDPRTGGEPEEAQLARSRNASTGRSRGGNAETEEHRPPVDAPSEDNTDRRV